MVRFIPPFPAARPHLYGGRHWAGLRVGLLGGSFNPAHDGHRTISTLALKHLGLHQVWWLVSPQNPLKPSGDMAPLAERLAGARRAAAHPRILPTDIEQHLGTRYTADTLISLADRFPETRFVWLMGADNLLQIPRWQHWHAIFETTPVAVFARHPYSLRAVGGLAAHRYRRRRIDRQGARLLADRPAPAWVMFMHPRHPESATRIRTRRARQKTEE